MKACTTPPRDADRKLPELAPETARGSQVAELERDSGKVPNKINKQELDKHY